jgi:transposase
MTSSLIRTGPIRVCAAIERRRREGAHGGNTCRRRALESRRTTDPTAQAKAVSLSGSKALAPSEGTNRHPLRAEERHSLGDVAPGNGMRLRHVLLAILARVGGSRSLGQAARGDAREAPRSKQDRLVPCDRGQLFGACSVRGKKTGPSPTDRRKAGSKHHLITDAQGIPLAGILTAANVNDVTQLIPLVDSIPNVRGKVGRPRNKPEGVQGDRGYDSEPHRREFRSRRIEPVIAKRMTEHGSGLGKTRWVIERTHSWPHQNRRLRVRYERLPEIHEAFLSIAFAMLCWNFL